MEESQINNNNNPLSGTGPDPTLAPTEPTTTPTPETTGTPEAPEQVAETSEAPQPTSETTPESTLEASETPTSIPEESSETPEVPLTTSSSDNTVPSTAEASQITSSPESASDASTPTSDISSPTPAKKKRTGLIVGIIIAVFLLIGGGVFAALAIIKNQPENIALASLNNLMNAKQVAVSGDFDMTPSEETQEYIKPIKIHIDSMSANSNQSVNLSYSTTHPQTDQAINLEIGEVMMENGVFYIKASGLQKIYQDLVRDALADYIKSQLQYGYQTVDDSLYENCNATAGDDVDAYMDCINQSTALDPATLALIESKIEVLQDSIEGIVQKIDNQWYEISVSDILNDELVKQYIPEETRESINKAYQCGLGIKNNFSQYSGELADLYSQNQFIMLEPAQDSYYHIKFDAEKLTSYSNQLPKTKLAADIYNCGGVNINDLTINEISAEDTTKALTNLPDIQAKFDGFLSHHLSDVKTSINNETLSASMNLHFAYPNNLTVSAPSDAKPIMDAVKDIIEDIQNIANELSM